MPSSSVSRDKSPLAVLLDHKKNNPRLENDIRLEDYLNDKIQTSSDFGNLDSLIANVEGQKRVLEDQVGGFISNSYILISDYVNSFKMPEPSFRNRGRAPKPTHTLCSSRPKSSNVNERAFKGGL